MRDTEDHARRCDRALRGPEVLTIHELLVDGLDRFAASADDLLRVLEERRTEMLRSAEAA